MNDYHLKLIRSQGDFIWRSHAETDKRFILLAGESHIEFQHGVVTLGRGARPVSPKGVEHEPLAGSECHVLLGEPAGTRNTGDEGG